MKQTNENTHEYIKSSLIDYISSKPRCTLKWIIRKLCSSGLSPGKLANLFAELKQYADEDTYWLIFDICRNVNFDSNELKR
jgi:hypothetical protein